ncbi:MAG: PilT/PilU family type 4a pilus ATPase [Verrucomicrobia bacterium]|nr:PilT/PilU family type 4a pilus ATPase [Verrucomicrobiota bacterium]
MTDDLRWLAYLGIEQKLLTRAQCLQARAVVGTTVDLMAFAQELIDSGVVTEVERLEELAGAAIAKAAEGPPPSDPFAEGDDEEEFVQTGPGAAAAVGRKTTAATEIGRALDFRRLRELDDHALAEGMRNLLRATSASGASDLHLSTGARPFIRKARALSYIAEEALTADDALRLNTVLLSDGQRRIFLERKDYDYALALSGEDRYRVNLMFHKNGSAGAYRMVPAETRSLEALGFAKNLETLKKMLSYHNGLILITGPVGSGKTTTLASMVAYLNETRSDHIITVEDPIEVVQPAKGCNVTQREVGPHTRSFASALKGALREDPDVIVIGELRDLETIEMAISASETGHLVIGTMHTSDAATTLNRLLDVFPPSQQTQIRASVAESLRGIVCQRLLPGRDGHLVLACEILVSNTAIQNLIREGKSAGLKNTMETGVKEGMCLMDNVVFGLWQEGRLSAETARANIPNRVLRQRITG